jgi:hypothetical protein
MATQRKLREDSLHPHVMRITTVQTRRIQHESEAGLDRTTSIDQKKGGATAQQSFLKIRSPPDTDRWHRHFVGLMKRANNDAQAFLSKSSVPMP